ncbi:putative Fe-containing alcohol dehydrogenase [Mycena vulgaris]|nr:putative Fe-containing alcohol dehydrogenase [Mycena vulgaris]
MASQEIFRSAVPSYPGPLPNSRASHSYGSLFNNCDISYGLPFPAACAKHVEETFHATRILILSSGTLARSTRALSDLQAALGAKVAAVKSGLWAHTYFSDILAAAEECRALGVELILTLGGGSLTDAAKVTALVLANDIKNSDKLLKLPTLVTAGTVPPAKHQFVVGQAIKLIILDAALVTETTPLLLFVQSGVRALDHCIEAFCSAYATQVTEMHAKASLARLVPGPLRCIADGDTKADVEARLLCQMSTIDAIASFARVYAPVGGSHAIGHILGPFGVVHGATSGILLPAVCKYNARHSTDAAARQATAKAILWSVPEMRTLAESKGLAEGVADLGDLLNVFVRALGMARTLKEVGVGRDKFAKLAEFSVLDPFAPKNPVPLKEPAQIMEILEMVTE